MVRKLLSLGSEGKLFLKSPDGKVEDVSTFKARSCVYLLIDCSGSMVRNKLDQAKNGASSFSVDALAKGYSVGVIQFASHEEIACEPQTNIAVIDARLHELVAGGTTNLTGALQLATNKLTSVSGTRGIVIVTDGMPDNRDAALRAAEEAKSCGIEIVAIGTDDADATFLCALASQESFGLKVPRDALELGTATAAKLLPRPSQ